MKPGRLLQTGGLAGLAFLVLNVVGQVSAFGADAKVNDPIPSVVAYYFAHGQQMITAEIILAVGVFCFMWFLGAVYHLLRATPEPDSPLPAVVLVSGTIASGMLLLERIPQVVLALMAGQPGGLSTGLAVRALADMQGVMTSAFIVPTAVLTLAIAAGLVRLGVARSWLVWFGGVTAALFLASGLAGFATLDNNTWDIVLHLADLGAYVIVAVAALALIRQPGPATASALSTMQG